LLWLTLITIAAAAIEELGVEYTHLPAFSHSEEALATNPWLLGAHPPDSYRRFFKKMKDKVYRYR
jgi:hypothetical protein